MSGITKAQALNEDDLDSVTGGAMLRPGPETQKLDNRRCPHCDRGIRSLPPQAGAAGLFYECCNCGRIYENVCGMWADLG